jgi:DNA polymerase-3 subunit beta
MKISCLQENLSRGLSVVGRAVATKTTLPITNNILLATEQSRLKLAATNLEIAISCWIGAKVEEEGAITIPARVLTEFVNSLPNERADLTLSRHTLELRCARFEARISGIKAEDFPPIPEISEGLIVQVEPAALRLAISQVVFAAASEDTRPVLTGVHAEFDDDILTLAAADGFRLAVHKVALVTKVAEKIGFIIPGRTLSELSRFLAEQEELVEMAINPNRSQMLFRLKNVEMISQLIQGTFPNYKQLIPQSYATRAVVNTSEFLRATRAASIFARDGGGIVRLQIVPGEELSPGKITTSARSEQMGDNVGEVDAIVDGEAAKIAFNGKYLMDALSVLHEGQVALEVTTPSSPGVVRPVGSENYIHVVMPMFVQWG